jgi:hypothetical protein
MGSAAISLFAAALRTRRRETARLAGEAIGMLVGELEEQFIPGGRSAFDLIPGDRARFILRLHFQLVRGNDFAGKLQDVCQLLAREAVIGIIPRYPGLEKAGLLTPNGASAIDEVLHHMPHFRYMEIGRDRVPIRKDKPDILGRVLAEDSLEGGHVHAIIGICS